MSGKDEDEAKLPVPKFSSFKSKAEPASDSGLGKDERLTVPKFASSRPKGVEKSEEDRRHRRRDEDREDRKRHHRSERSHDRHDRHSKRRRHESDHRHREDSRTESTKESLKRQGQPQPSHVEPTTSSVFFFDKKGDPLIIKYGGLERAKIPAYRRYGAGRVMGTAGRLIIHREGARDQFSLRMPGEGSGLFKDKDGLRTKKSKLRREALNLRPRKTAPTDPEEDDFLALESKKNDKQDADTDSSDDEALPSYRAIELKPKKDRMADDSSDESESEGEVPSLDQSNPLKWRSIQLSRQVKKHPEDIDAWIELVDHQETLLRAGESLDHKVLENEAHSFTEIKVSMLESALSNATNPEDRSRVLNYLMREGVKVWNTKTAEKKWSEVAEEERQNFLLWKTHLNFCQSNIASFQYDEVKQMLITRLRQTTSRSSSETAQNDWSDIIYVFLRATRFIHDAGYRELAIAAWQALLEINLFQPSRIEDQEKALDDFQDFWESEVPRIGEAGAQGWKHFVESNAEPTAPEPLQNESQPEFSRDAYKAWANSDRLHAEKSRLPARTMDEGTEDDPFRVVMYSDIESLLFLIPKSVLPKIQNELVDAFLIFSGLPPCFCSVDWIDTAWQDPYLAGARGSLGIMGAWNAKEDVLEEMHRKPPNFAMSSLHARYSTELLFPGADWFNLLAAKSSLRGTDLDWVRHATQQVIHAVGVEGLSPYCLALGPADPSTSVKKLAKNLLKRFPTNISLYNTYAMAEHAQGNKDVALKVLNSATGISQGDFAATDLLLWKTLAWLELEAGNKALPIKRLCSSVDKVLQESPDGEGAVPGAYVLKARQVFSSYTEGGNEASQTRFECLAFLAYLTADGGSEPSSAAQGNISAAMASIDDSSHSLRYRGDEGIAIHEGLLQFGARLLYFHATRGPFRRAYMREQLVKFLKRFPQNSVFLSLLEWSDSSLRVVDETRTLLYDKVLVRPYDCVSSRVFAIEHELRCGNVNTTKAAFEHAVSSDVCQSNVQVWISYIRFCQGHKQLRPKAKDVFYRALRHCPWSKDVMMEAFGTLIRDMESSELRSVYNTLTSKGLRIHADLDEFLDRRRNVKDEGSGNRR